MFSELGPGDRWGTSPLARTSDGPMFAVDRAAPAMDGPAIALARPLASSPPLAALGVAPELRNATGARVRDARAISRLLWQGRRGFALTNPRPLPMPLGPWDMARRHRHLASPLASTLASTSPCPGHQPFGTRYGIPRIGRTDCRSLPERNGILGRSCPLLPCENDAAGCDTLPHPARCWIVGAGALTLCGTACRCSPQ